MTSIEPHTDNLENARRALNGGFDTAAAAQALIDIATSLRKLTADRERDEIMRYPYGAPPQQMHREPREPMRCSSTGPDSGDRCYMPAGHAAPHKSQPHGGTAWA